MLRAEHEIHSRRRSRNVGLGLVLGVAILLIFGLTIVKLSRGDVIQGFDHRLPKPVLTQGAQP
ncbi:MAG: hypothetical protein Q4G24_01205 [Paracoccus sp. (in: a-proteobacteria)]|uniref:hypothetical protein n=1 Tax=Paracoccus sp. TaxID=267 RepID=UPI0026E08AB4|nr:hypothetical protein [Paracoccus sp. (in: a-proteobacteria)]MDO5620067.1 hypothetical protein [Paracoccus sp. (in: a-proteobacteria)]